MGIRLSKKSSQSGPSGKAPWLGCQNSLRGSGSGLLNTAALQRLTGAEWRELTQFAAFLTTGVETKPNAQIATRQEADLVWERFATRLEQAPDVVFRRVMSAPRVPSVFEHTVLYPAFLLFLPGRFLWGCSALYLGPITWRRPLFSVLRRFVVQ